nr:retrovirus-related Pol polyprotein from transposon TNT 1-94 [Tanacetum cinerariifolium]
MSSAEAEYVIAAGCCAQVLWIKTQLADYDVLYDKSITQPKALTNKKSMKKKNPSSSQPKSYKNVKETSPNRQVTETQPVEELVATANATKSVDASKLIEGLRNHRKPTDVEKYYRQVTVRRCTVQTVHMRLTGMAGVRFRCQEC